jgi:hypothetical protein
MKTLLMLLAVVVLVGCATRTVRPPPLSPEDIIALTKAGVADDEIVRRIVDTRTVYRLGADEVVRLRNAGVSAPVINFMMETYSRYVAERQAREDYYDSPAWGYGVGVWYGGPWGGPWHRW